MNWLTQDDPRLVLLSFLYVVAVIVAAEAARRGMRLPPDVSRKVVHVLVAAWALPTALLFDSAAWAAAMPLAFVGLNALSYKFRLMALIEEEGAGSKGTIYFPLSFALLILALWGTDGGRAASVAGLFAMGFGDASASVIGRRWGNHTFAVPGGRKSLEGSLAMFGFSLAGIAAGVWLLTGNAYWTASLAAAAAATAAEAPSARGADNITVPVAAAAVFLLVAGASP